MSTTPPNAYCSKRFYDGKFIHLKKKDKQIEIKCTDVMPNRTFYSSAQISALVTLQLSVVTIYCIGALIHHLASAACPCKTIYISFINHLSIHNTVEHSFVSGRDEKASTQWSFVRPQPASVDISIITLALIFDNLFEWQKSKSTTSQPTNELAACPLSNKINGQRYVRELILDSVPGGQGGCRGNSVA